MMAKNNQNAANPQDTVLKIPQYSLSQIVFMYAWPAAWFMFLIYVVAPQFALPDGTLPTWAVDLTNLFGHGAELLVALIILRREGYRLNSKTLRARINLRFPNKLWKWAACFGAFVLAVGIVIALLPLETQIATLLPPPDWMPDHPLKEAGTPANALPPQNLVIRILSWVFQAGIVFFIGNIIGEELYYRAVLQPKLKGVFGKWDWAASGVLFGLKHLYVWWRVPYLIPAGLAFGFVFGPMGSLPLTIFFHWLANVL
jgi:uncharacterized protein